MLDYREVTGKTVEEAFTNALLELETTSDNVDYEVLDKGSVGILGFMSRPAKIKAWKKSDAAKLEELAKKAEKTEEKTVKTVKTEVKAEKKEAKPQGRTPSGDSQDNGEGRQLRNQKPDVADAIESDASRTERRETSLTEEQIEQVVRNFLGQMFTAMDIKVEMTVKIDKHESTVNVELSGEEMGLLIGKRGQTLDSIQYLLSLVVNKESDKYLRVKVDTEDYRKRRKETLEALARNIAYKVRHTRRSVSLEPMNPYERRIIHSALQNDKFVATKSEGEEPFRHVIIYLKNDYRGGRDNYRKKEF